MTEKESVTYEADPGEPISIGIVRAVAVLENTDPMELPPLYQVLDPEALDALVESNPGPPKRIEFDYYGYEVIVREGDHVTVVDPEHE